MPKKEYIMSDFERGLFYSPDDGGAGGPGESGEGEQDQGNQEGEGLQWDTWHGALPEAEQKLIADHEGSLKSALKSERDARGEAEKSLREVAAKLEEGSDAQKQILELADAEAAASLKAEFYEEAHNANVTNLKLAYHVATTEGYIDKKGKVDFAGMKEQYPELFVKKFIPDGGAGEGTGGKLPGEKVNMNALIRKKAGR